MMSPLNIHNSSGVDSTTPAPSHSPDHKSPSMMAGATGGMPLPVGPLPGAAAASLLHAFGNNSANALAQMFPGFPLHMAAAAAAAFYSQPHPQAPPPPQQTTPFQTSQGGQFSPQQQQQVHSILAAARQNQLMSQLTNSNKNKLDESNKQQSQTSSMPPPPPSMVSPSNYQARAQHGHSHPLTPLAMMARGQQNSPSHQHPQNILSPVLFGQQQEYNSKRKLPAESADVPASASDNLSAFSIFNQRIPGSSGSTASSPIPLQCPICNISLEGIDVNAHFFEEMHKIDSLRKMAEWSKDNEGDKLGYKSMKEGSSPYEKFATLQQQHASSGIGSYQKKLQLPQSRWETFQRIRQNRHTRLAAFMRFTRRKYEAAYEPTSGSSSAAGFPFAVPPQVQVPVSHHSPSASSSASSSGSHRSPVAASQMPSSFEHLASKVSPVSSNDSTVLQHGISSSPSHQAFPHPFLHPALSSFYQYNQLLGAQGAPVWPQAYPFANGPNDQFAFSQAAQQASNKIWRNVEPEAEDARSDISKRSLEDEPEFVSNKQLKKEPEAEEEQLDVESVQVPPRSASNCSSVCSSTKSEHSSVQSAKKEVQESENQRVKRDHDDDELDVVSSDCESESAPNGGRQHFSNPHRLYSARRFETNDNSVSGTESVA